MIFGRPFQGERCPQKPKIASDGSPPYCVPFVEGVFPKCLATSFTSNAVKDQEGIELANTARAEVEAARRGS